MRATELEARLRELFDDSFEKNEIWLAYTRKALDQAHANGIITDAQYHEALGVALGQMGDFEPALEHGREAVRLSSGAYRPRLNLANTLMRADALDDAAALLETIAHEPHERQASAWCLLAGVLAGQGRWKSARRAYRAAASAADQDQPSDLLHLAVTANNVGLPSDALRLTARMLAIRQGGGPRVSIAAADPAAFVESAEHDDLKQLPPIVVHSLARYLARRRTVPAAEPNESVDTADTEAVLEAWRDTRGRANAAVMGDDDGST